MDGTFGATSIPSAITTLGLGAYRTLDSLPSDSPIGKPIAPATAYTEAPPRTPLIYRGEERAALLPRGIFTYGSAT